MKRESLYGNAQRCKADKVLLLMKKDDRKDLIFDDLYEPEISDSDLSDEEMKEIKKEHERLGIKD